MAQSDRKTTLYIYPATLQDDFLLLTEPLEEKGACVSEILASVNEVGDTGAGIISGFLERKTCKVELIALADTMIGKEGSRLLFEALRSNCSLLKINLHEAFTEDPSGTWIVSGLLINSTLQELILSNNFIGNKGARFLGAVLTMNSALQALDLSENNIKVAGVGFLAEGLKQNSGLLTLDLRSNAIGDDGFKEIARALECNHSLIELDVANNGITAVGAGHLLANEKSNRTLRIINLGGNQLRAKGASKICQALSKISSLEWLNLSCNAIEDSIAALRSISKELTEYQFLKKLYLGGRRSFGVPGDGGNKTKRQGGRLIGTFLRTSQFLEILDFSFNYISSKGVKYIAEALIINTSLRSLYLAGNEMGDAGMEFLCGALQKNSSLRDLDVSSNKIGCAGIDKLKTALEFNSSLFQLSLSDNIEIGDAGAQKLADCFSLKSFSLQRISLRKTGISNAGFMFLFEALKANESHVYLGCIDVLENDISRGNLLDMEEYVVDNRRNKELELVRLEFLRFIKREEDERNRFFDLLGDAGLDFFVGLLDPFKFDRYQQSLGTL